MADVMEHASALVAVDTATSCAEAVPRTLIPCGRAAYRRCSGLAGGRSRDGVCRAARALAQGPPAAHGPRGRRRRRDRRRARPAAGTAPPDATLFVFVFRAKDGIRDTSVTGVQTCALPI